MKKQPTARQSLYDQKIHSLFTQVICDTESLYEKVAVKIRQNSQLKEHLTTNRREKLFNYP